MKALGYLLIASPFLAIVFALTIWKGWLGLAVSIGLIAIGFGVMGIMIKGFDLIDGRRR